MGSVSHYTRLHPHPQSVLIPNQTQSVSATSGARMCGEPCIKSVCGLSLQKSVFFIGLVELVITAIATVGSVWKYSRRIDTEGSECEGKDICIGPIIKHCVFDAFFGIICALLLIFGAKMRNSCLLISWMLITIGCSIKYIVVVCTNDWSSLEDWISITYLLFYTSVFLIVISFLKESRGHATGGHIHSPPPYKA